VHDRPHVVALCNVIPKPNRPGKFRLIVDLRCLNQHVQHRSFKYITHANTYRDLIEEGDHMISLDLEAGYFHVDVHKRSRTYLGFRVELDEDTAAAADEGPAPPAHRDAAAADGGRSCSASCPCRRDSCYVFTEVMKLPVRVMQSWGLRVLPYLDDFLVSRVGLSRAEARAVLALFEELGFLVNFEKSVLDPTRRIENLGFVIDTVAMTYELTPTRLAKFADAATELARQLYDDGTVQARAVAKVTGHAAAAALIVERKGRLHTRFLNDAIRDAAAARRWSDRVPLGPGAVAELEHWLAVLPQLAPTPIRRPVRPSPTVILSSDASDFAWGGKVLWAQPGVFPDNDRLPTSRGVFDTADRDRSSTWRELYASSKVLHAAVTAGCEGQVVEHRVDSQSAMFVVRNAGSQNRGDDGDLDLHPFVLDIDGTAAAAALDYEMLWVPREENTAADEASKLVDRGNYSLDRERFAWFDNRWGPHDIDWFADGDNHQLDRFCARYWAPGAEAVDAFSVSWRNANGWFHPPLTLIARVVGKLRDDHTRGTLVAPRWTSAAWWPALYPRGEHGPGPVIDRVTIPAGRRTFIAGEDAAELGHDEAPRWTMLALRVDFSRQRREQTT